MMRQKDLESLKTITDLNSIDDFLNKLVEHLFSATERGKDPDFSAKVQLTSGVKIVFNTSENMDPSKKLKDLGILKYHVSGSEEDLQDNVPYQRLTMASKPVFSCLSTLGLNEDVTLIDCIHHARNHIVSLLSTYLYQHSRPLSDGQNKFDLALCRKVEGFLDNSSIIEKRQVTNALWSQYLQEESKYLAEKEKILSYGENPTFSQGVLAGQGLSNEDYQRVLRSLVFNVRDYLVDEEMQSALPTDNTYQGFFRGSFVRVMQSVPLMWHSVDDESEVKWNTLCENRYLFSLDLEQGEWILRLYPQDIQMYKNTWHLLRYPQSYSQSYPLKDWVSQQQESDEDNQHQVSQPEFPTRKKRGKVVNNLPFLLYVKEFIFRSVELYQKLFKKVYVQESLALYSSDDYGSLMLNIYYINNVMKCLDEGYGVGGDTLISQTGVSGLTTVRDILDLWAGRFDIGDVQTIAYARVTGDESRRSESKLKLVLQVNPNELTSILENAQNSIEQKKQPTIEGVKLIFGYLSFYAYLAKMKMGDMSFVLKMCQRHITFVNDFLDKQKKKVRGLFDENPFLLKAVLRSFVHVRYGFDAMLGELKDLCDVIFKLQNSSSWDFIITPIMKFFGQYNLSAEDKVVALIVFSDQVESSHIFCASEDLSKTYRPGGILNHLVQSSLNQLRSKEATVLPGPNKLESVAVQLV